MDETIAGKFKLLDLLTVPMQRILKYHMLLQRLVGQTQASHETRSTTASSRHTTACSTLARLVCKKYFSDSKIFFSLVH